MIDDWPTIEEQEAAKARGCTCTDEQDAYCAEHGDRLIMRATIDKLRAAILHAVFKGVLS